jgi:predicted transcriptional regulator
MEEFLKPMGISQYRLAKDINVPAYLTKSSKCFTLYYMKTSTLTIRLDKELKDLLAEASKKTGKNRSEIAREALRRQLRMDRFEALRKRIMPFAEARGFLTDEDIFSKVS